MRFCLSESDEAGRPAVVLVKSAWDDYGHKTSFSAYFIDISGTTNKLGDIKILQRGSSSTSIPATFNQLPHEYCSLGQALRFYEKVRDLGPALAREILTGLRDIVINRAAMDEHAED